MEELGRRFDAAGADVAVVVTPHSVHVEGHFAVVTRGEGRGVGDGRGRGGRAPRGGPADPRRLVRRQRCGRRRSSRSTGEPRCRSTSCARRRIVVVAPARDRPLEEHLRLGEAIAALPGTRRADRERRPRPRARRRTARTASTRRPPSTTRCYRRSSPRTASTSSRSPSSSSDGEGRLALATPRAPGRGRRDGASGRPRLRRADATTGCSSPR